MESKKLPAPVVVPTEIQELSCQIEQWRTGLASRCALEECASLTGCSLLLCHGLQPVSSQTRRLNYDTKPLVGQRAYLMSAPP